MRFRNGSFSITILHYVHLISPIRSPYPDHLIFRFYQLDFDLNTVLTENDAAHWVIGSRYFEGRV